MMAKPRMVLTKPVQRAAFLLVRAMMRSNCSARVRTHGKAMRPDRLLACMKKMSRMLLMNGPGFSRIGQERK